MYSLANLKYEFSFENENAIRIKTDHARLLDSIIEKLRSFYQGTVAVAMNNTISDGRKILQLFPKPWLRKNHWICGGAVAEGGGLHPESAIGKCGGGMRNYDPKEFKVVALRDCPVPEQMKIGEEPGQVADYWRMHIATHPYFDPERECFVVLFLNVRKRVKGQQLVTIGTMDTCLIHAREVFRAAIVTCASAIVLMHNHPSGDPTPSEADIKVTRDLIRAGQLMKIEVLDHVIMGNPAFSSLRGLGYFYN